MALYKVIYVATLLTLLTQESHSQLNAVVCGSRGSSVATAGVWPWMASLQKNGCHVCGGTLVAVDSVLSNADCFSSSSAASEWTVVLGRLKQNGSNPFEVTLKVTNITLSTLTGSNVAVLHLAARPTLSNYIQPICLDNGQTFTVGSKCWAAGWSSGRGGVQQVLQEFQTSVVNCGNASTNDSICTGSFTLEQGDSGGPMMCQVDGSWFQAAVLSVNNNTANTTTNQMRADPVMVFTKLSRYQTFLAQTVGEFLSPASSNSSNQTTTAPTNLTTTAPTNLTTTAPTNLTTTAPTNLTTTAPTNLTTTAPTNLTTTAPTNQTTTHTTTHTTTQSITTASGGSPAHPFFFFHLLVFFVCLHLTL